MKAYRTTEISFNNSSVVDFQKNKKLLLGINALSLIVFIFLYIIFDYFSQIIGINTTGDLLYHFKNFKSLPLSANLIFIGGLFLVLSIHELIHGIFFFICTKEKPLIGFKSVYAYAAAPSWFINKNYFQVITLSPLVIMTVVGFVLIYVLPHGYNSMMFFLITVNAAGSIGDVWMSYLLLRSPKDTFVNDSGVSARISYDICDTYNSETKINEEYSKL